MRRERDGVCKAETMIREAEKNKVAKAEVVAVRPSTILPPPALRPLSRRTYEKDRHPCAQTPAPRLPRLFPPKVAQQPPHPALSLSRLAGGSEFSGETSPLQGVHGKGMLWFSHKDVPLKW